VLVIATEKRHEDPSSGSPDHRRAVTLAHVVFLDRDAPPVSPPPIARTVRSVAPRTVAAGPRLPAPEFPRWVLRRAGLRPECYREPSLARRLPACLRALRAASADDARQAIERSPELLSVALDALLIGVGGFFRDPEVFAHLVRLLPQGSTPGSDTSVWSAACSDGAELVTVALLLAEEGRLRDALLLGTDARPRAIARARSGVHPARALQDVPEALRRRYFAPDAAGGRLVPDVRRSLSWRVSDVLAAPTQGPWDAILCRNLAIYLEPAAAQGLWSRLHSALKPGGLLVVGKAEHPRGIPGLTRCAPCIYRNEGGPA
jgi:chemotaxis methyl-accepting protein methylase